MLETTVIAVVTGLFAALLTYFITTASSRSMFEKMIDSHERRCAAVKQVQGIGETLDRVKTAVTYLVTKSGGNPREMGLVE
jgi:hypothetical protein